MAVPSPDSSARPAGAANKQTTNPSPADTACPLGRHHRSLWLARGHARLARRDRAKVTEGRLREHARRWGHAAHTLRVGSLRVLADARDKTEVGEGREAAGGGGHPAGSLGSPCPELSQPKHVPLSANGLPMPHGGSEPRSPGQGPAPQTHHTPPGSPAAIGGVYDKNHRLPNRAQKKVNFHIRCPRTDVPAQTSNSSAVWACVCRPRQQVCEHRRPATPRAKASVESGFAPSATSPWASLHRGCHCASGVLTGPHPLARPPQPGLQARPQVRGPQPEPAGTAAPGTPSTNVTPCSKRGSADEGDGVGVSKTRCEGRGCCVNGSVGTALSL